MNRPLTLTRGRYTARFAGAEDDMCAVLRLRSLSFRAGRAADCDAFDDQCHHVLVEDRDSGQVVCCYRLLYLESGAGIARSYSAQFYDLSPLDRFDRPMVEMGRFCTHAQRFDPDIIRLAWGAMTAFVDQKGIEMLFGCSSFRGAKPERYADAFALLRDRHLAPVLWRPRIKAPSVFEFCEAPPSVPDPKRAHSTMPPLLRTYLLMGAWVSDHAVIDHDLDTLHVFTGLETRTVLPGRARRLRTLAG